MRDGEDETAHSGGEGAELEDELSRDVLEEASSGGCSEEGEEGLRHVAEHNLDRFLAFDLLVVQSDVVVPGYERCEMIRRSARASAKETSEDDLQAKPMSPSAFIAR